MDPGCRLNMETFGSPAIQERTGHPTAKGNGFRSHTTGRPGLMMSPGAGHPTITGVGLTTQDMVGAGFRGRLTYRTPGVLQSSVSLDGAASASGLVAAESAG